MPTSPHIFRVTLARQAPVRMETWDAQGREGDSFEGPRLAFDGRAPPELEALLDAVYTPPAPERQAIRKLGHALSSLLFDDLLRNKLLKRYIEVSKARESRLRLELVMPRDDEALASLPWEFLCIPGGQLSGELWPGAMPHIVFSRRLGGLRTELRELEAGEKLRILVVICDPPGAGPQADDLAVDDAPLRQQLQALARQEPDLFAPPVFLLNPDRDAIDRALEDQPHFFHFIGHTRQEEQVQQVALAGPARQARWVDVDQMAGLFARHLPAMVLFQPGNEAGNRAPGALAALARRAIEANVPVAVGMQYHVLPANGYRFAAEFYRQVAHGEPIDVAVQEARYKLSDLFESREFASPVLYLRVKESRLFHRKPQAPVRVDAPQAAQLRQSLMLLDYNPLQRTFDRATVRKGSRVEAMLVTGRPLTGKRWFVRRVLESLQRGPGGEPWIKLDLNEIFIYEVTIPRLWDIIAAHHLDMPEGAPVDEIINNLCAKWQGDDLFFVISHAGAYGEPFVQEILAQFWKPLATAARERPEPHNWLLLFLLDNDGRLMNAQLDVPVVTPDLLVPLPPAPDRFDRDELDDWLLDATRTVPVLQPYLQEYARLWERVWAKEGHPTKTILEICKAGNLERATVERTWFKI